jgi:arylsulfatase A-like enzyme
MNALVLVIDRLHTGYVGAYGNTWIQTPSMDRLAVEGFVFDQFLIDSPHLSTLYRSYWHGLHALCPQSFLGNRSSLPKLVSSAGIHTTLLTDDVAVAKSASAADFHELVEWDDTAAIEAAEDIDQTHLARCFARIIDWFESAPYPFLLWCHLTAFDAPWDAPYELRHRCAEREDPDPPEWVEVPCRMLERQYDPDELLSVIQCYTGQVLLLDTCLGALWEYLDAGPAGRNTLVVMLSARGFPLGEHLRIGPADDALYSELVHVPLLLRLPDGTGAAARSQCLVHPADVWATILDWWDLLDIGGVPSAASLLPVVRGKDVRVRDRLCLTDDSGQKAIRTPAWYLRGAQPPELFAKPDDRWEVNDVADRCHQLVEPLKDALSAFEAGVRLGSTDNLPPLDEALLQGLE